METDSKTRSQASDSDSEFMCMTRRHFLLTGASAVVLSSIPGLAAAQLVAREYPRQKIASLKNLKQDQLIDFTYPPNNPTPFFLVKLGEVAGAGQGPDGDVVAFSYLCSHMGGPLHGSYKPAHKAIGPCPLHLTTFDLTRHGIVISGHATESLPQAQLEISGGDIYATGVMGLIYGQCDNLA